MKNIPFTHNDVEELPVGFNSSGEFPNRRTRRAFKNSTPNSTKVSKHSMTSATVIRKGKYLIKFKED